MASSFQSERLKAVSRPFLGLAQRMQGIAPGLDWTLERARIGIDAVDYIAITLYVSITLGVAIFLSILIPSYVAGRMSSGFPVAAAVGIAVTLLFIFYMLLIPRAKLARRSWQIDKDLGYALKDLEIQTSAGIPIFDAIVHVANGGYGVCSEEFQEVVKRVQSGESLPQALDNMGMRTASVFLRRIVWQIVNALYAGSDISAALRSIGNDLVKDKETKIRAYGQSMNLWGLLYMLMVIVLPSQGITLLIILSALVDIFGKFDKNFVFGFILLFMFMFQFLFIGYIKNKRPAV